MVRLETHKNKQADQIILKPDEAIDFIENNKNYTLHEVIYQDLNKLFFDIDKQKIDLYDFKIAITRILTEMHLNISDLQMFVA